MKAFALVPNNPSWIVKFDWRWLFNWIALDIQLCFLCLPALSFLILVFFSYISSFRSSSIEIVYRCFDFLMSIKLKFGKFYHLHSILWIMIKRSWEIMKNKRYSNKTTQLDLFLRAYKSLEDHDSWNLLHIPNPPTWEHFLRTIY